LFSWGESGTNPGCFNIIHNICCDDEGWVYVADRENHRIQIFDGDGRYESQWNNLHRPCGLFMEPRQNVAFYKLGRFMAINREFPMSVRASAFSPTTGRCRYPDIPAYGGGPSRMAPA
jgi:hypothetical protein